MQTKPVSPDWPPARDLQLATLYPHMRTVIVAATMGISIGAVNVRAEKLGLRKTKAYKIWITREGVKARSPWNWALEEIMVLMFPYCNTYHLAELLGMTHASVAFKARATGIKKDKKAKSLMQRERNLTRAATIPRSYHFKPGMQAWNKGLKTGS